MPLMSLAEYSRHRGVSKPAVTQAIRDGRISTTTDHDGKRVIDSDQADQQWSQNTAHEKRRNTKDSRPGIAPLDQPLKVVENARPGIESPAAAPPGPQIGFDPKTLLLPDKPSIANGADNSYSTARAYKEHFLAKQAEQDFLVASGKLVDVGTIQKEWSSVAASVRTKVLGIPSKAKQRIQDLTNDQYLAIEKLVREALEDLSEGENDRA